MDLIWWSLIVGSVIGGILSAIFGVYSKATATAYARSIFGMQSDVLITNIILVLVAASVVFLSTVSIMIRDITYPTSRPSNFSLELFLMAFAPSVIVFAMTVLRGYKVDTHTLEEFGLLFAKFGVIHLLLQLSGFYSYIFPPLR